MGKVGKWRARQTPAKLHGTERKGDGDEDGDGDGQPEAVARSIVGVRKAKHEARKLQGAQCVRGSRAGKA